MKGKSSAPDTRSQFTTTSSVRHRENTRVEYPVRYDGDQNGGTEYTDKCSCSHTIKRHYIEFREIVKPRTPERQIISRKNSAKKNNEKIK